MKRFFRRSHHSGGGSNEYDENTGNSAFSLDQQIEGAPSPPGSPTPSSSIQKKTYSGEGELAPFDACIETCDALAASSSLVDGLNMNKNRRTGAAEMQDCSVRVSPDGFLIMLPSGQGGLPPSPQRPFGIAGSNGSSYHGSDDDRSAIVVGYDGPGNDRAANGFTCRGWSSRATTMAIRQTVDSMMLTRTFADELLSSRAKSADAIFKSCRKLFDGIWDAASSSPQWGGSFVGAAKQISKAGRKGLRNVSSRGGEVEQGLEMASNGTTSGRIAVRIGPLLQPGTTLHAAITALEEYHSRSAQADLKRWGTAPSTSSGSSDDFSAPTQDGIGENAPAISPSSSSKELLGFDVLSSFQSATKKSQVRAKKRERALSAAYKRVDDAERLLTRRKTEATKKWNVVREAATEVRVRMEGHQRAVQVEIERQRLERERERTKARKEELQLRQAQREELDREKQAEVWEMVSQMAKAMDDGDFAPTGNLAPLSIPEGELNAPVSPVSAAAYDGGSSSSSRAPSPSFPPMPSREELELEFDLPQKKLAAMAADDAVEDAAGALLNALSNLDTVRRSARIASEACMLSAANEQVRCLRSLVALERASLEQKLKSLGELEKKLDTLDVRADLDLYVEMDKHHPGGTERGNGRGRGDGNDDDDGGVASALAVLDCHSQGLGAGVGVAGTAGTSVLEGWGSEEESGVVSRDEIESFLQQLFADDHNERESESCAASGDNVEEQASLENAVEFLVSAVSEKSSKASSHRASVCYALNNQRSFSTEVTKRSRFDGLCRVFVALLDGCTRESGDIANAKMCMMLSQTFFMIDRDEEQNCGAEGDCADGQENKAHDRMKRIYVKSRLIGHQLWSDNDFWDQALFQCVSESLTQSDVMSNLQRAAMVVKKGTLCDESCIEKEMKNIKWHDFHPDQRTDAAMQLHAVVFSQLGALAHSMLEFGCTFEMAISFVRRLSVRHQLPINQRTMLLQHLNSTGDIADTQVCTDQTPEQQAQNSSNELKDVDEF